MTQVRIVQKGERDFQIEFLCGRTGRWQYHTMRCTLERARIARDELVKFGLVGVIVE